MDNQQTFRDLVIQNRSYRRFDEAKIIELSVLRELVDLARLSGSGGNIQPLKYILSNTPETNSTVFPCLAWAASLSDWDGPAEGERPSGYIIILGDTEIARGFGVDHGIASQSILLGATERGLGGCMIGSVKRKQLAEDLNISSRYEILLVLALGKPAEEVVLDQTKDNITCYWRDEKDIHHVPKRSLDEIILA